MNHNLTNSREEKLDLRHSCSEEKYIASNRCAKLDEICTTDSENEETYNLTSYDENRKTLKTGKLSDYSVSKQLILICIVVTLGNAVPVGYNLGIINAPASIIQEWCKITMVNRGITLTAEHLDVLWATIVSIFLIGGAVGSLGGGWLADKLGRKIPLMVSGVFFIVGTVCFALCRIATSIELLIIGRFLVGLASGIATSTAPMYLSEIAPLKFRGSIGTFMELGVTFGLLLAQICTLEEILGTENLWQCALCIFIVLVIFGMIFNNWFPESPKYLYILKGEKNASIEVIRRLRNTVNPELIQEEIIMMENEIKDESEKRSIASVLSDRTLLLPIILVCFMQAGQQLSGVNSVFFYSVSIFEIAGIQSTDAKWANLGTGFISFATVCISSSIMAKINRRTVILSSCTLSAIFMTTLFVVILIINLAQWLSYVSIIAVIGFTFAFEFGLGPIPYFIGSELLDSPPRPVAMGLGSLSSWTCNFLVGMTFPILQSTWGAYVFLPYIVITTCLAVFLWFYLPETRGKTSTQVAPLIKDGFKSRPLKKIK